MSTDYREATSEALVALRGMVGDRGALAQQTISITLGLPPAALSPNARTHWAHKARAVKQYRRQAWAEAVCAVSASQRPRWERAEMRVTWYLPDLRRRDPDNLQASLKSAVDGLVDAGLLADDRGLVLYPATFEVDRARPRVVVELRGCETSTETSTRDGRP